MLHQQAETLYHLAAEAVRQMTERSASSRPSMRTFLICHITTPLAPLLSQKLLTMLSVTEMYSCIDKSSSAELSEAINSMFRWYRESAVCYAYLSDVHGDSLQLSRWFTRGWTLQELIAPPDVRFFNVSWAFLGCRNSKADAISRICGIDESILRHGHHHRCDSLQSPASAGDESTSCNCGHTHWSRHHQYGYTLPTLLPLFSVATKLSWASQRQTTREEDIAYCLLGLFNVNMPLIYGEGQKAFSRLLKETAQGSNDQSILAWQSSDVLAPCPLSPADFPNKYINHNEEHIGSPSRGPSDTEYERVEEDTLFVVGAGEQGAEVGVPDRSRTHTWRDKPTHLEEHDLDLTKAERKTLSIRSYFGGSERKIRARTARETRIILDDIGDYSVAHCVPDYRLGPNVGRYAETPYNTPRARHLIVTMAPDVIRDNIIFLESPSGPYFSVTWGSAWCRVNDISDIGAVLSANGYSIDHMPSDAIWEMAKDIAQPDLNGTLFSNLAMRNQQHRETSKQTIERDRLVITAELSERTFLSQRAVEVHISIKDPSKRPERHGKPRRTYGKDIRDAILANARMDESNQDNTGLQVPDRIKVSSFEPPVDSSEEIS
ncbi:hypothetical protein PG996_010853 [Apiospora saccharicola]|uniref:Vegetative incompatibility protein HET-E-1 n=1 Tax=Apiospora saccharicola TaxID=335842 RepID=A0ABR1UPT8_9PEZI